MSELTNELTTNSHNGGVLDGQKNERVWSLSE